MKKYNYLQLGKKPFNLVLNKREKQVRLFNKKRLYSK